MQIHFNTHQALWFAVVSTGVWISNGIQFQDQSCKVMLILPNLSSLPLWQEVTFFLSRGSLSFQRIFEKPSSDIFSLLTVSDNELWSPVIFFLFENKVVDIWSIKSPLYLITTFRSLCNGSIVFSWAWRIWLRNGGVGWRKSWTVLQTLDVRRQSWNRSLLQGWPCIS